MSTADCGPVVKCRLRVKCRLYTVDFLTESCYHFHHWQLTVNRLTGALFRLTWVIFRLTTTISLENTVYGWHSIMEITRHLLKKSVVCSLHFTTGLPSAFYPQSEFYPRFAVRSPQSAVRSPQSAVHSLFYTDRYCVEVLCWVTVQSYSYCAELTLCTSCLLTTGEDQSTSMVTSIEQHQSRIGCHKVQHCL